MFEIWSGHFYHQTGLFLSMPYFHEYEDQKFKLSSLDFLLNPLRDPQPFEKWSPYEIACFEASICKFGKDFELINKIIRTKSISEIQEFYYQWEKTIYHEKWENNYNRRKFNK